MEKQTQAPIPPQEEILRIKDRYDEFKNNYLTYIEEIKQKSVRKVINKGYLQNVLPFEYELQGDKLKNKTLDSYQKDCCVYYFDEHDRVILLEEPNYNEHHKTYYSYHTVYTYYDNYIEKIYADYTEPLRIQYAYLSEGKVNIILTNYCKEQYQYDFYKYEEDKLAHIENYIDWNNTGEFELRATYEFMYGEKGNLTHILMNWAQGGTEYCYSTSKINFKQLEERLKEQISTIFQTFLEAHPKETFTRLGIECSTGHVPSHITLNLDTETDIEELKSTIESGEDWKYFDIGEVELFNFPLDDSQNEKALRSIANVLITLPDIDWFKQLHTNSDNLKIVFINHNAEVAIDYPRIRKLLRDPVFDLSYN